MSSGSGMFPFPSYIIAGAVYFLQHPNFLTCINDEGGRSEIFYQMAIIKQDTDG